ncbi:MAG: hypothetical protein DRP63_07960 [Planctomycetota bacterium]|nr:MAG: hypothetical protein DRP63_07960 [Planctomycetota bacterium]
MAIELTCPGCGKRLRVADSAAGKKGKCPACGAVVEIPTPGAEVSAKERKEAKEEKERKPVSGEGGRRRAVTRRRGGVSARMRGGRSSAKLPPKLQRRAATQKLASKRGEKTQKREFDPEAAEKRKKRRLIILAAVAALIIAGLILSHIFYFGPLKRRYVTWVRAMQVTSAFINKFSKDVLDAIPLQALPEDAGLLNRLAQRAKKIFARYQKDLSNAGDKDVVENLFKKSQLYAACEKMPKMARNFASTLVSILNEKQDYVDEGRAKEWEQQKSEAMKRYLAAYINLERCYVLACYLCDAWNVSVRDPRMNDKDWERWTEKWIEREMGDLTTRLSG